MATRSKDGTVLETRKAKVKPPPMYKVLLLNDDYTPMEFVVHVLERFFQKSREEATRIMLHVHRRGVGVCGVYTYEVAETKVTQVMDLARQNQHPLQCTIEKEYGPAPRFHDCPDLSRVRHTRAKTRCTTQALQARTMLSRGSLMSKTCGQGLKAYK